MFLADAETAEEVERIVRMLGFFAPGQIHMLTITTISPIYCDLVRLVQEERSGEGTLWIVTEVVGGRERVVSQRHLGPKQWNEMEVIAWASR